MIKIKNYDMKTTNELKDKEHPLMPKHPFRLLICGGSGSGKTNLLVNMLMEYLVYDRVYIYTRHMDQPKYKLLRDFYSSIEQNEAVAKQLDLPICIMKNKLKDFVPLEDIDKDLSNILIFDDFVSQSQTAQRDVIDAFISCRHKNCSAIYLSQSYFATPKDIRLQCDYFIFFDLNSENEKKSIGRDHAGDISKEEFRDIFGEATEKRFDFLFIDKVSKDKCMRYRNGFDGLYCPD